MNSNYHGVLIGMSSNDYDKMLVSELRLELQKFQLPTSGKKSALIDRLKLNISQQPMISLEADLVDEESRYDVIMTRMKTQVIGPLNIEQKFWLVVGQSRSIHNHNHHQSQAMTAG